MKYYVGARKTHKGVIWEVARTRSDSEYLSMHEVYEYALGPFKTLRGAKTMVWYGYNNPHILRVKQAEKYGKDHPEVVGNLREWKYVYVKEG